ncbi:MAG: hypothetical protein AB1638_12725, partial [Nitrospirota bacterium]
LLDRLLAMKNVSLFNANYAYIIVNSNSCSVDGVTLIVSPGVVLHDSHGKSYTANDEGEVVIDSIAPDESVTLLKHRNTDFVKNAYPDWREYLNLVFKRSLIWLFSHRD